MKLVQQEVGAVRGGEEDLRRHERAAAQLLQRVRLRRVVERHHRADVRMRVPVVLAVGDRDAEPAVTSAATTAQARISFFDNGAPFS